MQIIISLSIYRMDEHKKSKGKMLPIGNNFKHGLLEIY